MPRKCRTKATRVLCFFSMFNRQPLGTQGGFLERFNMGRCKICGQVNGHADGCPNSGNDVNNSGNNYHGGEIRCSFCQTMNPIGSKKCRGCNASLEGSVVRDYEIGRKPRGGNTMGEDSGMRQPTQKEASSEAANTCPECGFCLDAMSVLDVTENHKRKTLVKEKITSSRNLYGILMSQNLELDCAIKTVKSAKQKPIQLMISFLAEKNCFRATTTFPVNISTSPTKAVVGT